MQCADVHILMIDRGNLDRACQLTAAAVINQQSQVILDVMTAIINDKVPHSAKGFLPVALVFAHGCVHVKLTKACRCTSHSECPLRGAVQVFQWLL